MPQGASYTRREPDRRERDLAAAVFIMAKSGCEAEFTEGNEPSGVRQGKQA
jgi:hypothetical protein